jgi:hypothetical protein
MDLFIKDNAKLGKFVVEIKRDWVQKQNKILRERKNIYKIEMLGIGLLIMMSSIAPTRIE